MSAFGRVWRRAPAWRMCLITAMACTALTAMFPPAALRGLLPHRGAHATSQPTPQPAAGFATPQAPSAHFTPQQDHPPADSMSTQVPPAGADRNGVIPFAGRQIPLPAGNWKDLVLGQIRGDIPGQLEILGRIENGQLTGLLQADAPSPSSGAAGSLGTPAACYQDNAILRDIAPETANQNPLVHECWVLVESDITANGNRAKIDEATRRALDRAQQLGAAIPDHMLLLLYMRSSETGWLRTLLLLPADQDVTAAANRRIQAWCKRFAQEFHQGYDSKLPAAGIPPAVARDPT